MNIYQEIELDFSRNDYRIIKAKQGDALSRYIKITCTDGSNYVELDPAACSAYVRYKKPDGYSVFNQCDIIDNKIYFELTAQMLSVPGTADVDVVIYNSINPTFDNEGNLSDANVSIISTMNFAVEVIWNPLHDSDIESADEFRIDNNVDELMNDLAELRISTAGILEAQTEVKALLDNIKSAQFVINFEDGHLYYQPPEEQEEQLGGD